VGCPRCKQFLGGWHQLSHTTRVRSPLDLMILAEGDPLPVLKNCYANMRSSHCEKFHATMQPYCRDECYPAPG
jgi:hypothetical protein